MVIRRIGLTGGIGSGKSTVAGVWVGLGATLVDTDAIARELTIAGGAAMPDVQREFGDAVIDAAGSLDRERMRTLAFGDPTAKRRLEAILHPLIGTAALARAERAAGVVLFDVPLMTETSVWRGRCDRVLVVDCSEQTQVARVMRRSGWSNEQVHRVIAQQAPRSARRAIADAVIDNDEPRSLAALQAAVQALWALWVGPSVP